MKKIFIYLLFFYINNLYADKNIIDEKISNWYSNLCSSNIEGVVSLYSSNITFLPTTSKIIIKDLKGVRDYFIAVNEKYKKFVITKCELLSPEIIFLNTDTVIVTGIDEFEGKIKNENDESINIRGIRKKTISKIKIENDNSFNIKGRQSFIFKKENTDWKIIHHHRSSMPK